MGLLVDGVWHDTWYDTKENKGKFKREQAQLRHWITKDGSAGPSGDAGFKAESGRYHLYVCLACPWAHRTLIFRALKGLAPHIGVSIVSPDMLDKGWSFDETKAGVGDELYDSAYLYQLYLRHNAQYSGRVTVPMLWDKKQQCIVNNESAEIIRMFNSAFDDITGNTVDFYPTTLQHDIDEINTFVYDNINNGVYKTGFATTQSAYEEAYENLFSALDDIEQLLATKRYLVGEQITEADWRLFTTLIRFDAVYFGHFKCNKRMIEQYPNLANYVRELFQVPHVAETVNFKHIKRHYYFSHDMINPTQIVPVGPDIDYHTAHNRAELAK
ncbi:glutathione S-transferase family protein [Thalassotalea sp. 1_MG-2023]|uniref:glutathione S-transferase family protein n=1 Tax=Thalassotalea sp. 1_MG-2023 TaxID=3062680 RepID=UPI0026E3CEF9|nr:glutathione S-transferase family protein [Thalassotalea sp. 1_MG-2023]MDO6425890.1 glutathione S-transferase family protein [Thalassotalea sp. 1_MG-2023]